MVIQLQNSNIGRHRIGIIDSQVGSEKKTVHHVGNPQSIAGKRHRTELPIGVGIGQSASLRPWIGDRNLDRSGRAWRSSGEDQRWADKFNVAGSSAGETYCRAILKIASRNVAAGVTLGRSRGRGYSTDD